MSETVKRETRLVDYPTAPHDPTTVEAYHVEDGAVTAPGLAHRFYVFSHASKPPMVLGSIQFQRGPIGGRTSTPGVHLTHVIAIAADLVRQYSEIPGSSEADAIANAEALSLLRGALAILTRRRDARAAAGVLGTMQPTPSVDRAGE